MNADLNNCSKVNEECQNTNGSFACVCKDGYRRNNTNQQCIGKCTCKFHLIIQLTLFALADIDECSENAHTCSESENEMCVNTNGAFNCSCYRGYSRNSSDALCSGKFDHLKALCHNILSAVKDSRHLLCKCPTTS